MAEAIEVSFVIPCYRCRETLPTTLESIRQQRRADARQEIIVVHSGWEDREPPQALAGERGLFFRERLLPGAARNRGAAEARGRLLAFVDADARLSPGWLDRMLEESARNPGTLLGGSVRNANPATAASRVLYLIEFSEFLPGSPGGERKAISTSNCLLPASLFVQLKGFDEKMAMSEDWEFCRRLPLPPHFVPEVGIEHFHRSDWASVTLHVRRLGYWSGHLRRSRRDLAGSGLAYFPPACLALLGLRYWRILRRRHRAQLVSGSPAGGDWSGLLAALWYWTAGFWTGIRGGPAGP